VPRKRTRRLHPAVLAWLKQQDALVAFVAERQRCGDLDGGRDDARVWLACSCGAQVVHPASAPPPQAAVGDSRK